MSNYINKVLDKDQNEYPLHDARIVATPEDVGKILSVDETGQLVFVNAPAGGTKLYKHRIVFDTSIATYQGLTIYTTSETLDNNFISGIADSYGPHIGAHAGFLQEIGVITAGVEYSFVIYSTDDNAIHTINTDKFTDTVTAL